MRTLVEALRNQYHRLSAMLRVNGGPGDRAIGREIKSLVQRDLPKLNPSKPSSQDVTDASPGP